VTENDKEKAKVEVEDLPVPLKDLDPEEEEEVKGGLGAFNPTRPSNLNPTSKPKPDQY
jgi:hypothetical protein